MPADNATLQDLTLLLSRGSSLYGIWLNNGGNGVEGTYRGKKHRLLCYNILLGHIVYRESFTEENIRGFRNGYMIANVLATIFYLNYLD